MKRFLCALTLIWVPLAAAQVPDHLKCYKIKDPIAKTLYTADLSESLPLSADSGCLIKTPGKLLCVDTEKTNVNPAPPGSPSPGEARRFVCYKVKCPKQTLSGVPWTDQFGTRTLTPIGPKMVCAPEPPEDFGPCVSGGCTQCGACGDGVCHLQGGGGGCGSIDSTPQCVSASTCTSVVCTQHNQCGPGQVCVFTGSGVGSLCCNPCP